MYKVLLVDNSVIDRLMMKEVMAKTFTSAVDVLFASEDASAMEVVKDKEIDLLIINVSFFIKSIDFTAMVVYMARRRNPRLSIILTSVTTEERVSWLAIRFGADGYLLKPYSGFKLASLVAAVLSKHRSKGSNEEVINSDGSEGADLERHLNILENCIEDCDYSKARQTVKEYLDLVYSSDNAKDIKSSFMSFAHGIVKIAAKHNNAELRQNLQKCLEQISESRNIRFRRFESTELIIEMIDSIFVELEKDKNVGEEFKRVLNYIELNIKKRITLDSVARYFNMSRSYFSKFFKKNSGINFVIYVTNRKIELAKYMLQTTDIPIINIAYELSYSDTNYFSKVFRKNVGLSPSEYRQCARKRNGSGGNVII